MGIIASRVLLAICAFGLWACTEPQLTLTAERLTGGNVGIGQHLVYGYGCGTCHVIPGIAEARGNVGPALEGFASRVYIAGSLTNEPDHLIAWLTDPQSIVPGNAMPNLGITREQARQIAAYLYTLQ